MNAAFAPEARQEFVESIRRYLTEAGAIQASLFESEVARTIALLARLPELGTPGIRNTRSIPLPRYPYSLQYRLEPDLIRILAVAHHSRRPKYWSKRGRHGIRRSRLTAAWRASRSALSFRLRTAGR